MLIGNYGQSNVHKLNNPKFKLRDFYEIYPQFGPVNGESKSDGNATDEQIKSAAYDTFGVGENKKASKVSDMATDDQVIAAANDIFGINVIENPTTPEEEIDEDLIDDGLKYVVPKAVTKMYLDLANGSLSYKRWKNSWRIGMCLYIAHYCTLYLQSIASPEDGINAIISAGTVKGLETSMSADGVSVITDYSMATIDDKNAGDFNLTIYGQQLLTLSKKIPRAPIMAL